MEDTKFLILDSEYIEARDEYLPKAVLVEDLLDRYLKALQSIVDEKIVEGETATALQNFKLLTQNVLAKQLENILTDHRTETADFITGVEHFDECVL